MNRRAFLGATAGLAASRGVSLSAPDHGSSPFPIIDTHTHFFDPRRPEGIPWPTIEKQPLFYRPVLPAEFRAMSSLLGVTGTVVVEAGNPNIEGNQWNLDLAEEETFIVGYVGHIQPGTPDFQRLLARFSKNRLLKGIRTYYGRLPKGVKDPAFINDLKTLAKQGLECDVAGFPVLLDGVVRISDAAPDLRIVIDHLPYPKPKDQKTRGMLHEALREIKSRPRIYVKVSEVLRIVEGETVDTNWTAHKEELDELWEAFGEDRVVYGSNWPASIPVASYYSIINLVRDYFATKGRAVSEKFFWKNSVAAYRWEKREANQPDPGAA